MEVIYGAGGHARELAFQLYEVERPVGAFIDDFKSNRTVQEIPVLDYDHAARLYPLATWHVAIGNIPARRGLLKKIRDSGLKVGGFLSQRTIVAPTAHIESSAQVFGQCVVSDSCRIADDVIINFGCTVSHDAHIGPRSIICPGVTIAGNVKIGSDVWLGVGCTVINGTPDKPLVIEDGAYVGAGACIVRDVCSNAIVYGVPAKQKGKI